MNPTPYQMEVDELAIGLTRPSLLMGVSIQLFFANILLCALVFIHTRSFLAIPLWLVLHVWMVRCSIKDPRFLTLWVMAFVMTPPVLNRWYWDKTNSYEAW